MDDISPLDLFREELATDDIATKVNCIHRLRTVATAMGPESTRSQLLPYLKKLTVEDDEVLFALSEELGKLRDLVGGSHFTHLLLEPLETLACIEETMVRDKAVEAVCLIAEQLPESAVQDTLVPIIFRLASGEWFTSRVSAAGMFGAAYPKAGPLKSQLRAIFAQLCAEDTPMVRRAAANKLGDFALRVEKEYLISDLLPVFKNLTQDDQDSIRVVCVESAVRLAPLFSIEENKTHLLPVLVRAAEEKSSWRVRLAVAKNFDKLAEALGQALTAISLLNPYVNLLADTEPDVRSAAVNCLSQSVKVLSMEQLQQQVFPAFQSLAKDGSQMVRTAFAQSLPEIALTVGRDITSRFLMNYVLELMRDENHEVRFNIVSKLGRFADLVGADFLNATMLTNIQHLAEDPQWRVRLSVLEQIPGLAKSVGTEVFQSKLEPLFMAGLSDNVYSVRVSAIEELKALADVFGPQWTTSHLLPRVVEHFYKDQSYLHRMTSVLALPVLASSLSSDDIAQSMLPVLLRAAKDPVPNIRFVVAKTIIKLIPCLDATVLNSQIRPCLNEMQQDSDRDVVYYARQAAQLC
eukprot:GILK01001880.1.p1 GENE.GILK01001880.1~~GILK01001880.1.p1  ORF type:complete len:597 (+),score=99.77 GILK01001880.1:60-1793(+)